MTEETYYKLADKYMVKTLEALDANGVQFQEPLADAIGSIICDCVLEAGQPERLFPFEVAEMERKIDTTSLDGNNHFFWNVIAGFRSIDRAEEYKTALSDGTAFYGILINGVPDENTMQSITDITAPDA